MAAARPILVITPTGVVAIVSGAFPQQTGRDGRSQDDKVLRLVFFQDKGVQGFASGSTPNFDE
jgi:hypothetical protein